MKKNYELVCVIDTALTTKDIDALKDKIHKMLPTVMSVDDIGLMPLAYPIRGQDQAYFISFHVSVTQSEIVELKNTLRLEKGLVRYVFYAMKEHETFLTLKDLQKSYDAIITAEEEAKMKDQKVDTTEEDTDSEDVDVVVEEVIEK